LPNEALVDSIKQIVTVGKSGDADGANQRWSALLASPEFATYRPEDQRQALKLLVLGKRSGAPSASLIEAHRRTTRCWAPASSCWATRPAPPPASAPGWSGSAREARSRTCAGGS
jgi:hypothetical protein